MKRLIPATLCAALLPVLSFAQETPVMLDANEDGYVSLDEMQAVYPDVTPESFISADPDGDGLLNEEELLLAREAGLLPPEDS